MKRIENALMAMGGMFVLVIGLMVAGILTMLLAGALSNLIDGIFKITVSKSDIAIGIGALLAVTGLLGLLVDKEDDNGEDNTVPKAKSYDRFGREITEQK